MNYFNNFNRSSKSYPLRNELNKKIMDSMPKPTTSNKDLLEQLKADKIEFDIPSDDEGGVGDRMGESEEEDEIVNSNKIMKGISPGAVLSVSEGPRPCKTKADNTDLVQANLSESIVGSSKDHPSKTESVLLTSHLIGMFLRLIGVSPELVSVIIVL
jgi:hypothetical protein